jgi:hypothetical protein|tara:strand:+ start:3063 stop:3254 length:192 start_codon:yes stop_codon:yes gene_type:complete
MSKIAKEDVNAISHINFVSNSIHDFGNDIYEDLMDRDHEQAKKKAQTLIKVLADLIQSLSDEI